MKHEINPINDGHKVGLHEIGLDTSEGGA